MRRLLLSALLLTCTTQFYAPHAAADETCNWTGTWNSTYGDLRLVHEGDNVKGDYAHIGTIEGTVDEKCGLKGSFTNFRQRRDGSYSFKMAEDRFNGSWKWEDGSGGDNWGGTIQSNETPELINQNMAEKACDWTGTWSSNLRDLRLVQDGNSVSGENGRSKRVSGTTNECRLEGKIEDPDTGAIQNINITKSGRRFNGTWSSNDPNNFQTYVWGGTLQSGNIPVVSQPDQPIPSEPAPEEPEEKEEDVITKASWKVTPYAVCFTQRGNDEDGTGLGLKAISSIYGIAWIKTRVVHKETGDEIAIAPKGGFPNLGGDNERAWEAKPENAGYQREGYCTTFKTGGLNDPSGAQIIPSSFIYEIDAEKYGYTSVEELLDEPRNRIRVMVKLKEKDSNTGDDDLGTQFKNTPLSRADFCGSCKATPERKITRRSGERLASATYYLKLEAAPTGDGVFSTFKDGDTEAVVLYDIKPVN